MDLSISCLLIHSRLSIYTIYVNDRSVRIYADIDSNDSDSNADIKAVPANNSRNRLQGMLMECKRHFANLFVTTRSHTEAERNYTSHFISPLAR